eukprot:58358_1
MVLLFEQKEVFHEGSIISNINNINENIYKYCIRSDIMYSKQCIDEFKSNKHKLTHSYEVEKQTVYFQRNYSMKSSQCQPNINDKKPKMNKLIEPSLTVKVIDFWFIEAFKMNNDNYMRIFPFELFEEII